MHLSTKKQQIEQTKQSHLPKEISKGRLPKTLKVTLRKSFYKYVRSKIRVKSTVGPLMDIHTNLAADDLETSEKLNMFYASVFTAQYKINIFFQV